MSLRRPKPSNIGGSGPEVEEEEEEEEGKLCVPLRSVILSFITAYVLQESNFAIRASFRRGKFCGSGYESSFFRFNAKFSPLLLIAVSTVFFTTKKRCPCTSLHSHNHKNSKLH